MTKKFVSLFLALAMCLTLAVVAFAADAPDTDIRKDDGVYISDICSENIDFKNQIWGQSITAYSETANQAEVSISTDKSSANVNLTYHGTLYSAVLPGQYTEVALPETIGYVGVYEGFLVPIEGESGPSIPVIADITFTVEEMFTILTLGYFDDSENFDTLYFGSRSQQIEEIARIYADKVIVCHAEEVQQQGVNNENDFTEPTSARINAIPEFWGSTSRSVNNYTVSYLSLFHAPELYNNQDINIIVKLNSDCIGAKNAIAAQGVTPGYTVAYAYPDTLYFSINSRSNNFHMQADHWTPKEGSTSFAFEIPFYTEALGFQTIPATLKTSTTKVTTSKIGTGNNSRNCIAWELWKNLGGWQNPSLDGDYTTSTGFSVEGIYKYAGNISQTHVETFSVTGSLRYEYILWGNSSSPLTQHFKTQNMTLNSSVKVFP